MDSYLGVAREEGIVPQEINTVQSIVMAVAAGKIRAQFREVKANAKGAGRSKE
jgi:hypothetical protein